MRKYTIGETSKLTGLSSKTIRFYESVGVIEKPRRTRGNQYRWFDERDVFNIRLIKNARDLGLPLQEIKKLMIGCKDGDCKHTREYNKKIIDDYVVLLSKRIDQMIEIRKKMVRIQKLNPFCCGVLRQLTIIDRKESEKTMNDCDCGDNCSCGENCGC